MLPFTLMVFIFEQGVVHIAVYEHMVFNAGFQIFRRKVADYVFEYFTRTL